MLNRYYPTIDEPLWARLDTIQDGKPEVFFAPTFKWLTRNPTKLLTTHH